MLTGVASCSDVPRSVVLQDWLVIVLFSFPVVILDEVLKFVGRIKQAAVLKARLGDKKKRD